MQADVLLIYPYFYTHAPKSMLFHPLGIAQLAAVLRGYGLRTRVIDCTVLKRINKQHSKRREKWSS